MGRCHYIQSSGGKDRLDYDVTIERLAATVVAHQSGRWSCSHEVFHRGTKQRDNKAVHAGSIPRYSSSTLSLSGLVSPETRSPYAIDKRGLATRRHVVQKRVFRGRGKGRAEGQESTASELDAPSAGRGTDFPIAMDALERYKARVLRGFHQETQKFEAALRDVLVPREIYFLYALPWISTLMSRSSW